VFTVVAFLRGWMRSFLTRRLVLLNCTGVPEDETAINPSDDGPMLMVAPCSD